MPYKNCLKCNRQYMNRREFVRFTGFVGIQKLNKNKYWFWMNGEAMYDTITTIDTVTNESPMT